MPPLQPSKILVIGAGAIVIGQGCEFDYSGTQACRELKSMGHKVILINPNPATIMTDHETADHIYCEAINLDNLEQIIQKHRPDYLLPTVGGQTALNAALELNSTGILQKYNIKMLAVTPQAIENAEDRKKFAAIIKKIGLKCPISFIAKNLAEAMEIKEKIGLPAIIRPSFTLGGEGGGIAYNEEEFIFIVNNALKSSSIGEVQIDQSVIGWKEVEYEVIRDQNGNKLLVCTIENLDPMGTHTGDSITCAPMLTVSNKETQVMRDAAFKILDAVGVIAGGANVQFAINPENGEVLVIEMNPRVSRSSALASKATGFPIAQISARLAVGETFDMIKNNYLNGISAALEPALDYVVVKAPKFNFKKFTQDRNVLSSSMKSIGEAMAIGRNFEEALQKALYSLESVDQSGLGTLSNNITEIREQLQIPSSKRIFYIADALRAGIPAQEIQNLTQYNIWFIERIANIINHEKFIAANSGDWRNWLPRHWLAIKQCGISDQRIADIIYNSSQNEIPAQQMRAVRETKQIRPVYKKIDSCSAEFETNTQYHYSSFENCLQRPAKCESISSDQSKVIIIGSGPNRIGQGIEFDYACVHACQAVKALGFQAIMINSNPSTVSTDFNTADKLYFEPLTNEHVRNILEKEKGNLIGIITQFGGQTPLNLLKNNTFDGYKILGTSPKSVEIAEDREEFGKLLQELNLRQVKNVICDNIDEIASKIDKLSFPILIRPSYVIGGNAMEIVQNMPELQAYLKRHASILESSETILIDEFLTNAQEIDVEIIGDGQDFVVVAIMEHIENAGVHSGDSSSVLPCFSINKEIQSEINKQSIKLAKALNIKGLINIQFAVKNDQIFVLEANPRSSRTVPFVAKALDIHIINHATQIILGKTLQDLNFPQIPKINGFAVKKPIFPFARFPKTNPILGPEMKSTGEVMGIDQNFEAALAKAYNSGKNTLPTQGNILLSVQDCDKNVLIPLAKEFLDLGFILHGTNGTAKFLQKHDIKIKMVKKISEGRPNFVDMIMNRQIQLIINSPSIDKTSVNDGFHIRWNAISQNISYTTTITGAWAMLRAIKHLKNNVLIPHEL